MSIRSLNLLDLATLYRYRSEVIGLDSTRLLTRGNPLGAVGMMAHVNPQRHMYSAICTEDGATLLGGIIQTNGEAFAKLLYLTPAAQMEHPALPSLIQNLTAEAGTWGAFHAVAELEESSAAFVPLRRAGFSVYAWQRMWDVSALSTGESTSKWQRARSVDLPAIQNLHHQIVPPLLQPIEPAPKRATGFICSEAVSCHIGNSSGMMGVVLFPLFHPEAVDVPTKLLAMIRNLPNGAGRPMYVCVRSYQAWLEQVLEDLGARAGERQAIMVKHLTRLVKEEQPVRATQRVRVGVQPSRVSTIPHRKS